jgi:hypothetical protein
MQNWNSKLQKKTVKEMKGPLNFDIIKDKTPASLQAG